MTPLTPEERFAHDRAARDLAPPAPPATARGMDADGRAAAARVVAFVEAGGGEG